MATVSGSYYNENDPFAAAWLRELIKAGLITDGEVDTRSIELVSHDDVRGFVQCHFFAGIGGWSYALRLAGWPDDRPVWTGSCPCQPWSSAGAGLEADDPRDLWPTWFKLVRFCLPAIVFGEQVAGKAGRAWLDRLYDDMEACQYAVAPFDLPSCSVGAFDKRQRLWWVADSESEGRQRLPTEGQFAVVDGPGRSEVSSLANTECQRFKDAEHVGAHDSTSNSRGSADRHRDAGPSCELADSDSVISSKERIQRSRPVVQPNRDAASSPWDNVEWIECRDGKARPIEPGLMPLAHGIPARLVRLRGYGNAINPWLAADFIGAYLEAEAERLSA